MLKPQEEKEKVKTISPFSRREREILITFLQFREEKENIEIFSFYFESRKRKVK